MKRFKLLIVFSVILILQSCNSQPEKINGVSFVAASEAVNNDHITPVVNVNANYAAVMPFGFIRNLSHPEVVFNTKRQWFGETSEGVKQYVQELRKKKIKIMLKPQIWVWHGEFTGYIEMKNEANWKTLESSYSKFILEYARLAHEVNADIFCIGTELEKFIDNRPDYWFKLIGEIKQIYKGKLTYAANWDEFKRTPFWDLLDFIGVDAYFPVSNSKTPTVEECLTGWEQHKKVINTISEKYKKPILFTEFGYRSVDYSGREPWKSDTNMMQVNLEAQTNTTKALFETFWKEDWFAGGFIWKWFRNHSKSGGENNSQYTPQNKPVEDLIKTHYALYK
ncbi:glycoside hydrolase family 113 [Flavivirga spongiicola]|uniref:Glycoside hydrolase n=1 Tax=Flavivirga spongiicola TaxID=421621 RepID=A0ABU7XRV2_9FLAO|nr:glycoside hydrolase [Flavivirga sp. MEBiC05379]MDO5978153.1 glycoside hydrolase [Flavivirga sp. MEBiC05379]